MPFWRNYYHLIWATKARQHIITPQLERRLYPYIVKRASELGMYVYEIDGWTDHTHLVSTIPPKLAVADAVQKLKGASSYFVTNNNLSTEHFSWQRGYGALTLGQTQLDRAIAYVKNQKTHHAKQQSLNKWLEHIEDVDDGPLVAQPSIDGAMLKEDSAEYTTNQNKDEWLFP